MYATGESLPVEAFDEGTNTVCFAPPLSGMWTVLSRLAAEGLDRGDGCVVLSANEPADRLRTDYPVLDDESVRIVDCTRTDDTDGGELSVASPADLTGISIALSEAFDELDDAGYDRVRFVVDSVTTLAVYAEPKRLYRFVHTLTQQVDSRGAVAVYIVDEPYDEVDDEEGLIRRLLPLFDARIEFRTDDTESRLRVVGGESTTDWTTVEHSRSRTESASPGRSELSVADSSTPESLRAVFDGVISERRTLLVVNASEEAMDVISSSLSRLNVTVRSASLPEGPDAFTLLSRGNELIAAEPVGRVRVVADGFDGEEAPAGDAISEVFSEAVSAEFGVRDVRRGDLVRTSRLFERAALRRGAGTLHAGFQRLSRVPAEPRTHELYRTLVDAGVDVHLYGTDDAEPAVPGATVHAADEPEIRESWFVVYDGAGDSDGMGALLCFEQSPGSYDGFWTFREEIVVSLLSYLEATYGRTVSAT